METTRECPQCGAKYTRSNGKWRKRCPTCVQRSREWSSRAQSSKGKARYAALLANPPVCKVCGETHQVFPSGQSRCRSCYSRKRKEETLARGGTPQSDRASWASSKLIAAKTDEDRLEVLSSLCEHPESGCWVWTKYVTYNGYGRVGFNNPFAGNDKWFTHRLAFYFANGYTPGTVHHKCANRLCCNPDHLQDVTLRENMAEMFERQSLKDRIAELEAENARLREQLAGGSTRSPQRQFKNL